MPISISGTQTVTFGSVTPSLSITTNTGNQSAVTAVTLASGANTITVPTWAIGCVIVPNTARTATLTLKGVTGDTGVSLAPASPHLLTFPATPPANFVLTSGALDTTITEIYFF